MYNYEKRQLMYQVPGLTDPMATLIIGRFSVMMETARTRREEQQKELETEFNAKLQSNVPQEVLDAAAEIKRLEALQEIQRAKIKAAGWMEYALDVPRREATKEEADIKRTTAHSIEADYVADRERARQQTLQMARRVANVRLKAIRVQLPADVQADLAAFLGQENSDGVSVP